MLNGGGRLFPSAADGRRCGQPQADTPMDDGSGNTTACDRDEHGQAPCDEATRVILGHLIPPDGSSVGISEDTRLVIGSSDTCDVRLEGQDIAAAHCVIRAAGDDLLVEDLGAESGTLLNGKRIRSTILEHGDSITIGDQQVHLRTTAGVFRQRRAAQIRGILRWGLRLGVAAAILIPVLWLLGANVARRLVSVGSRRQALRRVSVVSDPGVAWLWIDGSFRGETPISVLLDATQEHQVKITKHGYVEWKGRVPVGGSALQIDARLRQRPLGRLVVHSYPPAATVYVAGKPVGKCLVEADVPSGEQMVRVECQGYVPFEKKVTVAANSTTSLDCILRYEDLERLRQRVLAAPRNASAHFRLVEALLTNGKVNDAIANLRIALGLVASDRDTSNWTRSLRDAMSRLYQAPPIPDLDPRSLPQFQQRIDQVFAAVTAEYAHPTLLPAFAEILAGAGKEELAERLCERAMARTPDAVAPYVCLAEVYRWAEEHGKAEAVLTLCQATRRPTKNGCFALAVAWSRLAPHCKRARAHSQAELRKALAACSTTEERERLSGDFDRLTKAETTF
jgi:tetratricopeptide (TPR) repeat protein